MYNYNNATYLIHYGVKGQKRGIRRFQNEDGSLTAEGKEHYGIGDGTRKPGQGQTASDEKKSHKGLKIAAAVTGAAAVGVAAYLGRKKATKLRDVMRSNASDEAKRLFKDVWANAKYSPNDKNYSKFEKSIAEYDKYKKIANSGTRRDAVRMYLNERNAFTIPLIPIPRQIILTGRNHINSSKNANPAIA